MPFIDGMRASAGTRRQDLRKSRLLVWQVVEDVSTTVLVFFAETLALVRRIRSGKRIFIEEARFRQGTEKAGERLDLYGQSLSCNVE